MEPGDHGHRLLERKDIFEGSVIQVYLDKVRLPDGKVAERELVRHWGAVAMVALDDDGEVYLVRQYRHPVGKELVEIPAGKLREGEDPLSCAKRELMEEVGRSAGRWTKLAEFYTSPGFSDEVLHLYLARDLEEGVPQPDEGEFIEIVHFPLGEALKMVYSGEIEDAKTVAGLALTSIELSEGRG